MSVIIKFAVLDLLNQANSHEENSARRFMFCNTFLVSFPPAILISKSPSTFSLKKTKAHQLFSSALSCIGLSHVVVGCNAFLVYEIINENLK